MQLFFTTRTKARAFTSKSGKVVDNGAGAGKQRWAFKIQKEAK